MDNPLISIIIPAYNIESYISRCLDSILNQSYENLEIIVVDDGSTDRTGMILDEYKEKDHRIKVIHKTNSGVSDTRNTGIDVARGEYIGFVDGDDTVHPDMYRILLDNAIKYDADISHCGYQMVFPNRKDDYYGTGKLVIQDHEKSMYDLLKADYIEPGLWNKLYKKELLKGIKLNKSIRINEDLLFNYYAFKKSNRAVFEDQMLYYYMVRSASASTQSLNRNKVLDPIKVLQEMAGQESGVHLELIEKRMLYFFEKLFSKDKKTLMPHISNEEYNEYRLIAKNLLSRVQKNQYVTKVDYWKAKMAVYCPILYRIIYYFYDIKAKSSRKYEV